ncbi:MAG TPA: hypothetical protein VMY43_11775 [Methanothrix sp.]|nr:hypothetical protein [Methanothrix sp.]
MGGSHELLLARCEWEALAGPTLSPAQSCSMVVVSGPDGGLILCESV